MTLTATDAATAVTVPEGKLQLPAGSWRPISGLATSSARTNATPGPATASSPPSTSRRWIAEPSASTIAITTNAGAPALRDHVISRVTQPEPGDRQSLGEVSGDPAIDVERTDHGVHTNGERRQPGEQHRGDRQEA